MHHACVPDPIDHELLDLGDGRWLQRFGSVVVDRPCPAADWHRPRQPDAWSRADARFERSQAGAGAWIAGPGTPRDWSVRVGDLTLELRLANAGQVGLFPEQGPSWAWLADEVGRLRALAPSGEPPAVLNLFAYTGAATLAAVAAGATAVHVDAARPAVAWARRNAALSELASAPVRWIVDDALGFAGREIRRQRRYDGIVLDPPSYGHGSTGRAWRLEDDLAPLLAACRELLVPGPAFVLLTGHTPDRGPDRLLEDLLDGLGEGATGPDRGEAGELDLETADGRRIGLGAFARWRR